MRCPHRRSVGRKEESSADIPSLTVSADSILLVRETGLEFVSDNPYKLFCEFDLDLEIGGKRFEGLALVVSCRELRATRWRISLLFQTKAFPRENLSLAA
jgi:hypothetical protein